jgi:hypothetical protein
MDTDIMEVVLMVIIAGVELVDNFGQLSDFLAHFVVQVWWY